MFVTRKRLHDAVDHYEGLLEDRDERLTALGESLFKRNKDYIRVLNENRRLRADLVLAQMNSKPQ